ncbi:glutamate--tRNA ligase GltX [Gottschalkia purinilytica]|uniref:Glutamate--tRNA ligase n=1 Tax=Gottschalkia purinilytica TaxID=1503 RepID=A0A0L0W9L7_GOTPU|nr:glutamate--tRNA ligase [Gottschalkia purinilytica]KNF07995.1 glutamate--tRNA ligase GltX [Gottschalkia purinilytica]
MSEVRVRFAPSPTGYLHIGGLRTALYDYLFAKNKGGKYILRIEDTDRTRYVDDSIENLIKSLEWSGVVHDEGVFIENGEIVQKGEYGPYIQSERLDIYKKYIDDLIEKGHAYYCFCNKERLDKIREEQKEKGLMLGYDGYCRNISIEEAKKRIEAGEEYVVRLRLPENRDIVFNDLIRGEISINTSDLDDQVLLKSDGFPTYHLAVVVDDHLMKITHVVRGEEWLPSAPKHAYLFEAFGWEAPEFVHLPTVLNKEKKKLSKRHGDVAVEDFRAKGYLPEGLINYLALVGWSPENNQEFFTMEELEKEFSFDRVSKTGGVFDKDKLDWVNGHYIRESDIEILTELAIPHLIQAGYITENDVENRYEWIKTLVSIVQERLSYVGEISEKVKFIFNNEVDFEIKEAREVLDGEQVPSLLDAFKEELELVDEVDEEFTNGIMKKIQKKTGVKGKNLFMPIRVALTGQQHGPEMDKIILVLGKANILERIDYIKNIIIK